MKFPLKNLILAASFSVATVAHAQGFAVDAGSLDYYLKQAQTTAGPMQGAGAQALVAQTETPPVNLGAPPSTYAPSSKALAAPSADTNQQILADWSGSMRRSGDCSRLILSARMPPRPRAELARPWKTSR